MNLEDFRTALESDATKRADEQEKTIKALLGKIKDRDNVIAEKDKEIEYLTRELRDATIELMRYERPRIDPRNPNALTTLMMLGSMFTRKEREAENDK